MKIVYLQNSLLERDQFKENIQWRIIYLETNAEEPLRKIPKNPIRREKICRLA